MTTSSSVWLTDWLSQKADTAVTDTVAKLHCVRVSSVEYRVSNTEYRVSDPFESTDPLSRFQVATLAFSEKGEQLQFATSGIDWLMAWLMAGDQSPAIRRVETHVL